MFDHHLRRASLTSVALVVLLEACSPTPATKPTRKPVAAEAPAPTALEQQLASNSPFAGMPDYQKPSTAVSVTAPTTKVGQRQILDDSTWHASVDKAFEAYEAFANGGFMRDAEDEGWRAEVQRGKHLMSEALEMSYEIEATLEKDAARARTYQALMQTRLAWSRKLREVGKIVRG